MFKHLFPDVATLLESCKISGILGSKGYMWLFGISLRNYIFAPNFCSIFCFLIHKEEKNFYSHSCHHEATLNLHFSLTVEIRPFHDLQ